MPDTQPPLATSNLGTTDPNQAGGTEALAHLAKMSGTGSTFGATDYVAINATSVASLIIGFAGALSLLISLLVFLPVVGFLCGLLGIRQIRRSSGTQGGYGFALGGILVSLIIGGLVIARETRDWMKVRADEQACADVISHFGEELHAGHFDNAYDGLTTSEFRTRVDRDTFRKTLEGFQELRGYGPFESMKWNGEAVIVEPNPGIETRITCLMFIRFRDLKEPARDYIRLSDREGGWKVTSLPGMFSEKKARSSTANP